MAKATKSKAAKPKSKSKATKPKAAKLKAAKPKAATPKTIPTLPTVRVVTPTDPHTQSIVAFEAELASKGWIIAGPGQNIDYKVYPASDTNSNLQGWAQQAYQDAQAAINNHLRAVLVACGSMAAALLQDKTSTIPIIQTLGGEVPHNRQSNMTGFTKDAELVARHHLNKLLGAGKAVTVLFDDTNDPSRYIYNNLAAIYPNPPNNVTWLAISDPGKFATPPVLTDGFMVISNAMYYNNIRAIVDMVDGKKVGGNPIEIYYPEKEFKDAHGVTAGVHVHGHKVKRAFIKAADLVNKILTNVMPLSNLPDFEEAEHETDS
jgi:hypothetical protein